MILAIDAGNTNIKGAVFGAGGELMLSWRMATDVKKTADEYGIIMCASMSAAGVSTGDIRGCVIASVVPSLNYTLEHMCRHYFGGRPKFVSSALVTRLSIKYDNPSELGADRICNAVAAAELFGGPCITVDFGTATTFGVVTKEREFLGGAICPGIKISIDALIGNTSMLPKVELVRPPSVIATNPVAALQAGIVYGYAGQIDYIIRKIREEIGKDARVVATGGMSNLIASEIDIISDIRPTLTLDGLKYIYGYNFN